jgi:hypothetical protein
VSPSDAIIERNLLARSILLTGTRAGVPRFALDGGSCGICAYFQVREIERLGSPHRVVSKIVALLCQRDDDALRAADAWKGSWFAPTTIQEALVLSAVAVPILGGSRGRRWLRAPRVGSLPDERAQDAIERKMNDVTLLQRVG